MRTIRNPRYAPEFLERKLSPTDLLGGLSAVAVVSTLAQAQSTSPPTTDNEPPPPPPTGPANPI